MYEEIVASYFITLITITLLLAVFCWILHMIVTIFGYYYIEALILRQGNDQLLDDLDEGVIIKDASSDEIIYINKSAKQIGKKKSVCIDQEYEKDYTLLNELFYEDEKQMAYVDYKIFTDVYLVDTIKTIENIQAIDDYQYFKSVVDFQL